MNLSLISLTKKFKGKVFKNKLVKNMDLKNYKFKDCKFINCIFIECFFDFGAFTNCKFDKDCIFEYCCLDNVMFNECNFESEFESNSPIFTYCRVSYSRFENCEINCASFYSTSFYNSDFFNSTLNDAIFAACNLSRVMLKLCKAKDLKIKNSILDGMILGNTDFNVAKIDNRTFGYYSIVPEEGSFIAWKKCVANANCYEADVLVKLEIPADAKRSSGTGRKCRASKVKVLEITSLDGETKYNEAFSKFSGVYTKYVVGETVVANGFDENRFNECSRGIHFFITREEAKSYG